MKGILAAVIVFMITVSSVWAETEPPVFLHKDAHGDVLDAEFIGTAVVNKAGEKVGSMVNVLLDKTGHAEYVVIRGRGFLGIIPKEIAIPFNMISLDIRKNKSVWVIDVTKEQLASAPGYKSWFDVSDAEKIWLAFGFAAQSMFFMRFLVQWIASERVRKSVVPDTFWYFSFAGGLMLFIYAFHKFDLVFMLGQLLGLVIYSRNIYLIWAHNRRSAAEQGLTSGE